MSDHKPPQYCQEHSGIIAKIEEQNKRIDDHANTIDKIFATITDIKDNLLRRPSWVVTIAITTLCTALAGTIVVLLTRGAG